MIHAFTYDDLFILLDVESGAVHLVDKLAYDAARMLQEQGEQEALHKLSETYPKEDVKEVLSELSELAAAGDLFHAEQPAVRVNDNGELKALCLNVAHDCNLRCRYCFAATGEYHLGRALMPLEVGKAALDFLIARSGNRRNLEVDFFGGEPLMNFDVVKGIVAYGRELEKKHNKSFHFTLTTNALGITPEVVEFANKELHNVVISIDGRKEVHDALRVTKTGTGSFDLVLPKAKELGLSRQSLGKDYYVRGTFTRNNLDFAKDVEFLADEGFEQISIEPVVLPDADPASIRKEDLPAVFEEYDRLARILYERRKDGRWFNFFHFMVDLENGPCLAKRMTGCGAGSEYIAVTPQGDIYPCHQFVGNQAFKMGSVLTGAFDDSIQKKFSENTIVSKEDCRACWAKYFCCGGCAANAQNFNGDISKPYEIACEMQRKRLECAIGLYIKERFAS
ncbi:MAG: thioether cross-link-forming SCIFF peptide maturase [Christensenellales bacterium]